ncbi:Ribosomal protein S12 methylthiotransferase RimO [Halodesulfovibrio sp. MK-HDV]|nr:Ribosomal protein S12 methylthiotransferase RimO [Halodesulfovibrio sp. MK-HDV]
MPAKALSIARPLRNPYIPPMTKTWNQKSERPVLGRAPLTQPAFLPMSKKEMDELGWDELDILFVTGDSYVDHPSFAASLLGRWLVAHGYRVGIIAQPRWDKPDDMLVMGRPRLFASVSAGAIDSMLAHYTAFRKKRHDDAYTPGGKAGSRPNRATIVYSNLVRSAFPNIPVVIGGIEASLRRITHYDFWTDKLRRSILLDSKADCVVYGMGEYAMLHIAHVLDQYGETSGTPFSYIAQDVRGIAYMGTHDEIPSQANIVELPSHEEIDADNKKLMTATLSLERHVQEADGWAIQPVGKRAVLLAPPALPLSEDEMDELYGLPYAKAQHPSYTEKIPCVDMMTTSITTHRGCGGGCSFCSLALHQGRRITSRSKESIIQEVENLTRNKRFNGSISDVGGPSANMWQASCKADPEKCKRKSCMHPKVCPQFAVNQTKGITLLRDIQKVPGIKNVRVASGVRFDLAQKDETALRAYTMEFTGGQLKVAPEHICDAVLNRMRKPGVASFEHFLGAFKKYSEQAGKEQYVVPYLMSAFPGCTDNHMRELGNWLRSRGWQPQQVQCFIPTPGTVATASYFARIDENGEDIFVAYTDAERLRQHHILIPSVGRKESKAPQGKRGAYAGKSNGKPNGKPDSKRGSSNHASDKRSERKSQPKREQQPVPTGKSGPKKASPFSVNNR